MSATANSDPSATASTLNGGLEESDFASKYVYYIVAGTIIVLILGLTFGFINRYTKHGRMSWRKKSRRCRGCQKRLTLDDKPEKRNSERLWCCHPNMYYCDRCESRA